MSIVSDDFEIDTGHFVAWYGSPTVTHSTADAHAGTGSLSVVPGGGFYGVTQSSFNGYSGITAGNQYTASIWHKAHVGSIGQHVMQVEWLDNTNTQISSVDTTFTPGASWTKVTATLTAPTGAVRINLGLLSNGTGDPATEILYDDFDISAASASLTGDVTYTSALGVSSTAALGANVSTALSQTSAVTVTATNAAIASENITTNTTVTTGATRTVHPDSALSSTIGTTINATRGAVADHITSATLTIASNAALQAAASNVVTSTMSVIATPTVALHITHAIPSTLSVTIDADVTSSVTPIVHGSWWALDNILRTASELALYYKTQEPVACPNCGEPLRNGPPQMQAIKYCPWGHFQYPRDWNSETMSGM